MFLKRNYIFILFYFSILIGFYFDEDMLGGAKGDYLFHLKFIDLFSKSIIHGLNEYGYNEYVARNSPLFYILLAVLNKIFSLETIRLINTLGSLILTFTFYKCLKIKFNNISKKNLKLLSCILFLSPTIRSLSVWPYPLLWGIIFFLLCIYFYLKFSNSKFVKEKYFYLAILSLTISSYFHYNFCFFGIFFLKVFFDKKKFSLNFFKLLFFCSLLSIPFIWFLFFRDGLHVIGAPEGIPRSLLDIFNFSNKILIISTILFFYLIPFFNFNDFYLDVKNKFKNTNFLIIFLFTLITLILFFNYPNTKYFGGGVFFKISYLLFENNFLFYLISFYSLFLITIKFSSKFNNILLILILLFFYNLQFTIYIKYFDPLLFILFFLVFDLNMVKNFFKNNQYIFKIYSFSISVYLLFSFKKGLELFS